MIFYQSSLHKDVLDALAKTHPDVKINVLRTYADTDQNILDIADNRPPNLGKLILDSGTFSKNNAKTITKDITLKKYASFLKKHLHKFDGGAFNYDEIFGPKGTEKNYSNQLYLEKQGLNVIPVIQDFKEVDDYCKNAAKYSYVAIGSGCRKADRKKIKDVTRRLHNAKVKVHLFAEASYSFMRDIPVTSSDSKSLIDWSKMKICCFFDKAKDKEVKLYLNWKNIRGKINKDYYQDHPLCDEYDKWLDANFGWSIPDMFIDDKMIFMANSLYYCLLERIITKRHEQLNVFA
jgi:hypothetical protein